MPRTSLGCTPSPSSPLARDLLGTAVMIATLLAARSSLADHYQVPTGSMEPTVLPGDHVLVDKRAYGLRIPGTDTYVVETEAPRPGDVVVLLSPETGITLLKRVVAGPGDVVRVRDGHVLRNGEPASDSTATSARDKGIELADRESLDGKEHALRLDEGGGPDVGPMTIPPGKFLVLGDNRGNSHDGRMFGLVAREAILGRAVKVVARGGSPSWTSL